MALKISALIPAKELPRAKLRLSGILNHRERRRFTTFMLIDVLSTVTRCSFIDETVVVSSDSIIRRIAEHFNASFLFDGGNSLNEALRDALEWCTRKGFDRALVIPSDVPMVSDKDIAEIVKLSDEASLVISPSKDYGTNALMLRPPNVMRTCFGGESFRRHLCKAARNRILAKIYKSPRLALDVDSIEDLKAFLKVGRGKAAHRFLERIDISNRLGLS